MTPQPHPPTDDVEAAVWAFEAAWTAGDRPRLEDFLPPADTHHFRTILRELACVELERLTAAGDPVSAGEYLARHPLLAGDPLAVEALRRQQSRVVAPAPPPTVAPRGGWQQQVADLYADFQVIGSSGADGLFDSFTADDAEAVELPELAAGDTLVGFRIVRPLGRGAFGRVYLAEQSELAGRPVALKVGARLFDESQALAQLQHTNIMPILSAHRSGRAQVVCMPYFGSTTLADVAAAVRAGPSTANAVWSTLAARASSTLNDRPSAVPSARPDAARPSPDALRVLGHLSHPRAVVWVGAQLASALAHAHERGVLHRDIKSANVLIADDGTPLLLDFNLAARHRVPDRAVGGTLPYMPPEQLDAIRGGARPVDERSDIYSLGLVLFELLTGRHPFPLHTVPLAERVRRMIADRAAVPSPARLTEFGATPALAAIVSRCLMPQPADRYPSARALHDDLQRQFDDRPLKHTREPSRRERMRKFLRRNPRFLPVAVAAALALAAVSLGGGYWVQAARAAQSEAAGGFVAFREEAREAELLLSLGDPADAADGERVGRAALARYGVLERADWQQGPAFARLPEGDQGTVRRRVPQLLFLLARAVRLQAVHTVAPAGRAARLAEAFALNERTATEGGDDFRRAVALQKSLLHFLNGEPAAAARTLADGETLPAGGSFPWLELRDRYRAGSFDDVENALAELLRGDPANAALWALRGVVARESGRPADAVAAFSTVHALRPTFGRALVWRAQAEIERGQHARAVADLDAALAREPSHLPALVYRGLARYELKQFADAEADLTRALELGATQTRIHFIRSRVRAARDDAAGSAADRAEGLRLTPSDELSWVARGVARQATEPEGALADFAQALRLNPHSREAAQNTAATLSEFLHKPAEAVAVLDELLTRYPTFLEARIGRAVLLGRLGRRELAHADAEAALARDRSGGTLYRAGCVHALTSATHPQDRATAFRLLAAALLAGFGAEYVAADDDLKELKKDRAEFDRLLELTGRVEKK